MPYNGNGVFTTLYNWVTDAANGLFVSSTRMQGDCQDFADGLTNCVTRDGQSPATADLPMGGFKITNAAPGSAVNDVAVIGNANSHINEFRLTLTSGTPVADATNATTIYACPYKGNSIALYVGFWIMRTSSQFSIAVGTVTSGRPYDIFCYDNSGVPTLEMLIWTSATARATALAYQDGVLVKSGDATRRYMGTFTPNSTTQVSDSIANRNLWNYSNRVLRWMEAQETGTWTYTTATIRQANANASNQLNFTIGVSEDVVTAEIRMGARNTNANVAIAVGVGLDSTSTFANSGSTGINLVPGYATQVANINTAVQAQFAGPPGIGKHALSWNEYSAATGTTTWDPVSAPGGVFGGIMGTVWS